MTIFVVVVVVVAVVFEAKACLSRLVLMPRWFCPLQTLTKHSIRPLASRLSPQSWGETGAYYDFASWSEGRSLESVVLKEKNVLTPGRLQDFAPCFNQAFNFNFLVMVAVEETLLSLFIYLFGCSHPLCVHGNLGPQSWTNVTELASDRNKTTRGEKKRPKTSKIKRFALKHPRRSVSALALDSGQRKTEAPQQSSSKTSASCILSLAFKQVQICWLLSGLWKEWRWDWHLTFSTLFVFNGRSVAVVPWLRFLVFVSCAISLKEGGRLNQMLVWLAGWLAPCFW